MSSDSSTTDEEKLRELMELFKHIHNSFIEDLDLDKVKRYNELRDLYMLGNPRFTSYPQDLLPKRAKVDAFIRWRTTEGLKAPAPVSTFPENQFPNLVHYP